MKTETHKNKHWNYTKWGVLLAGFGATVTALLYPPHVVCGGMLCGVENAYCRSTAGQFVAEGADATVYIDKPLYVCQILLALWITATVLRLCFEPHSGAFPAPANYLRTLFGISILGGFLYSCAAVFSAVLIGVVSAVRLARKSKASRQAA